MFKRMKAEILVTPNAGVFYDIQRVLCENSLEFKTKIVTSGSQNRRTGTVLGQLGENPQLSCMYYIFTTADKAEQAKHIVDEYRKGNN